MNRIPVLLLAVLALGFLGCGPGMPKVEELNVAPKVTISGLDGIVTLKSSGLSENKTSVVVVFEKVGEVNRTIPLKITYKSGGAVVVTTEDSLPFDVVVGKTFEQSIPGKLKGKIIDEIEIVGPGKPQE